MKPIAYAIAAYIDATHLQRLVKALDNQADFYVHIDRKVDIKPFEELLGGKVHFVKRHWVNWGGFNQVKYQIELLKTITQSPKEYSRIIILSGLDYPLWSNRKIHAFFEEHPHLEMIEAVLNSKKGVDTRNEGKVCNYHFFRDLEWKNNWLRNKLIVVSRSLMKVLPFRKKPFVLIQGKPAAIYVGSDWFSLTADCAQYVVDTFEQEIKLQNYFKTSFVPSELCIQTIVFNSPYASNVLHNNNIKASLKDVTPIHHIDYGKTIKIFTLQDYNELMQSGKMFCRKTVTGQSDTLLDAIDSYRHAQDLKDLTE